MVETVKPWIHFGVFRAVKTWNQFDRFRTAKLWLHLGRVMGCGTLESLW